MHRMMNLSLLILCAGLQLSACQSSPAPSLTTAADSLYPPSFVNGINASNEGSWSGEMTIRGTVAMPAWRMMYLYAMYGRTPVLLDSAQIIAKSFAFAPRRVDVGCYLIGPAENNLGTIILNPREKELSLGIVSSRMDGGISAPGSPENAGWSAYYARETTLLRQIREARTAAKKAADKAPLEQQAAGREAELLELQASTIRKYPGTYLAKLLTWKQEPFKEDKLKYWNNIDFRDESIIRSMALSDRIQNYMRAFSRGEESGFIDCIARIAEAARASDAVLEFSLNQMLIGFYESGLEQISTYIVDTYIHGDACGDANLSDVIRNTAESISRLGVGQVPPDVSGRGASGESISLMDAARSHRYTLLMFWSSWCEHCKGEAPEVVTCYRQYGPLGLEIVGYSVDIDENAWRAALAERQFTFPNLCGYRQWQSPAAREYRVSRTPTFFLLDREGKIVLKPKSIREVSQFLKSHLPNGGK